MNIEILQGYENSYSHEKNSVSIQIKTGLLLNQYLKKAIEKVDIFYISCLISLKNIRQSFFTIHFG